MPRDATHNAPDARLANVLDLTAATCGPLDDLLTQARAALHARLGAAPTTDQLDQNQSATHALAWLATAVTALSRLNAWAQTLSSTGRFGPIEALILQVGFGEYLCQIHGGIPMNQSEFARLQDIDPALALPRVAAVDCLMAQGNSAAARDQLAALIRAPAGFATFGDDGLDDDLHLVRDSFAKFARDRVAPHAHDWHLKDALIPEDILTEMAEMGVFGLTIPEEFGGFGMGKIAMCVVSEELSRGYIGVGSLGTRAEIAAELIMAGGTDAQKAQYLPGLSDGSIRPTAVFTEPDTGSDLGSLRTRATRTDTNAETGYRIDGAKTWITHAARANLMTLLARTDKDSRDYSGLSMFLVEKTPGTVDAPFPDPGISGSEIEVLGYRGMKEYELGLDGLMTPETSLLGGVEGRGFKQLMQTFESARIQTAARAIGVAQNALDLGLAYAVQRRQFGRSLIEFPRVGGKLALMAVEIAIARQLTYAAAHAKDAGQRCDLEAGMAKLLAARIAWSCADNALQIHGGNGFAMEYQISRVLCDARILNIFEGAAEIQAQVIARRLLA